jgi:2-(1,2-epoxy-1,2-dihydrophenyl)acetyl-CoA isomerase
MGTSEPVIVRRDDGAVTIVLNRPDALNAWTTELGTALHDALTAAAGDPSVRAVALTGAGRAFSSGADLTDVVGMEARTGDGHPDVGGLLTRVYNPVITTVRTMEKPVLAMVNGPAAGIGAALALAADLVVARESAYFLLAFVNIGLAPDGGASLLVPDRVGVARAAEMAMLGERVPAAQAVEWGLINRAMPDDAFEAEAAALLARLAAAPTRAMAAVKRQLNHWMLGRMQDQLALEANLQQELAATRDFEEGVAAFRERRAATFEGR